MADSMRNILSQIKTLTTLQQEANKLENSLVAKIDKLEKQCQRLENERNERESHDRNMRQLISNMQDAITQKVVERMQATIMGQLEASLVPKFSSMFATHETKESQNFNSMKKAIQEINHREIVEQITPILSRAIAASLSQSLQQSLTENFKSVLLPSFEGSCQNMVQQMSRTFGEKMGEAIDRREQQSSIGSNFAIGNQAGPGTKERPQPQSQQQQQQHRSRTSKRGQQQLQQEVDRLLMAGDYEQAFFQILKERNLDLLVQICASTDVTKVFNKDRQPLSQTLLLSLMSQLGTDLTLNTSVQLVWLQWCVLNIDPNDATLVPHIPKIFGDVSANVSALAAKLSAENPLQSDISLLKQILDRRFDSSGQH